MGVWNSEAMYCVMGVYNNHLWCNSCVLFICAPVLCVGLGIRLTVGSNGGLGQQINIVFNWGFRSAVAQVAGCRLI
jgi:hypothetical protein